MADQVYSVAELAKLIGRSCRHVRRMAPDISGHFIQGKNRHAFRNGPRLLEWIEANKKPDVVELKAKPDGMVGREVVDAARTYHDQLKANALRASLTRAEKAELRRWCAAIAKLPKLCR
jgi:CheY-like chemotaxis protein